MSTDIDWQHELDSSFGPGHDVPPGHYVAAGRRAVRRRRATALAAAAVVVLGSAGVWASGTGTAVRGDPPVATQGVTPTQGATTEAPRDRNRPRSTPSMSVAEEFGDNPAVIDPDGTTRLSPLTDAELQRVPNPMAYAPGEGRSVGLRVVYRGVETYSLMAMSADGTSLSTHTNDATGDFAGWLADKVSLERTLDDTSGGPSTDVLDTPDAWLTLGPAGAIASATPFVAVMEVRDDVDLGGGFALDAERTGVARLQVSGTRRFVAWRVVAGELDVVPGPGSFESTDAFVSWARQQYASGEGMR